jgi:hypothetical protein
VSKPKPVDPKVFELAQLFLPDATEAEVQALADDLQTACEDHAESFELKHQVDRGSVFIPAASGAKQ